MANTWSNFKGSFWGYDKPYPGSLAGLNFTLFGGGNVSNIFVSRNTSIYYFSSNSVLAGNNLTQGFTYGAGISNQSVGIFGGGLNFSTATSNTDTYTYSSNMVVGSGALSSSGTNVTASSNENLGLFLTTTLNGNFNTSEYNYSSGTVVSGNVPSSLEYNSTAAGNYDLGLFAGGYSNITANNIYIYSNSVFTTGTNLSNGLYAGAGSGSNSTAVFSGGYGSNNSTGYPNSLTSLFDYDTAASFSGASLSSNFGYEASGCNGNYCIFGGGSINNGGSSTTSLYSIINNSSVAATSLSISAYGLAACSPVPGVNYNGASNIVHGSSVLVSSGNFTVPNSVYLLQVEINSGAGGGGGGATDYQYVDQSGLNGSPGQNSSFSNTVVPGGAGGIGMQLYGIPGEGGGVVGGTGTSGSPGNTQTITMAVTPGQIIPYTVGIGGNGGEGKAYSGYSGYGAGGTLGNSGQAAPTVVEYSTLQGGSGGLGFNQTGAAPKGGGVGNFGGLADPNGSGGGGGGAGGIVVSY